MAALSNLYVELKLSADNFNNGLKESQRQAKAFESSIKPTMKALDDLGDAMKSAGTVMTAAFTLPLAALSAAALSAAIDFESGFAGVRKTVDATEPELAKMSEGFRMMAKEIPISVIELTHIGEAAGQLGISKDHVLGFSKVMAELGVTTNLTSDAAATGLAQLANITKMSQTEFENLGSTIVALGNAGASTESDIVSMGLRIAGAGTQVGMTNAQVLGFASALASVGLDAEAGGSAISKVLIEIAEAADGGGQKLNTFAQVAGMSAGDYAKAFKQDATGATIAFIEGLDRIKQSGGSALGALSDLDITEVRMRDTLLRASSAGDLLRTSVELGTQAWKDNNALTNEAAQRFITTESKMTLFKNSVNEAAISLGEALAPTLRTILDAATPLVESITDAAKWFGSLPEPVKATGIAIAALVAIVGPLLIAFGVLLTAIPSIVAGWAALGTAAAAFGITAAGVTTVVGGVTAAFAAIGPGGIAIALVALVAITYKIAEATGLIDALAKKIGDWTGASKVVTAANIDLEAATMNAARTLQTKYGVEIERGNKSLVDWNTEVVAAVKQHATLVQSSVKVASQTVDTTNKLNAQTQSAADVKAAHEKAKKAADDLADSYKVMATPISGVNSEFERLVNRINGVKTATDILADAQQTGVPKFESWKQTAEQATAAMNDALKAFGDTANEIARVGTSIGEDTRSDWQKLTDKINGTNSELNASTLAWHDVLDVLAIKPELPDYTGIHLGPTADELKKQKEALTQAATDVGNFFGGVWGEMRTDHKNFVDSFVDQAVGAAERFGTKLMENFLGKVFAPLKVAFDNLWNDVFNNTLGKILDDASSRISGLITKALGIGGGGAGGAAGSAGGAVAGGIGGGGTAGGASASAQLGAFLTNPITIGVAAAAIGVIALIKSQAHWEANELVQQIENPFWQQWGSILPSDNPGTLAALPMSQAESTGERLKAMNDRYLALVQAFAGGGSDEARVAQQSLANTQGHYAEIIGALRAAVTSGGGVPQFQSGGSTGRGGLIMSHEDEYVVPKRGMLVMREQASRARAKVTEIHVHIAGNVIGTKENIKRLAKEISNEIEHGGRRFVASELKGKRI